VIRSVGKIIADQIRATDKVARFGGEEFVVMLREVDEDRTRLLANRIREAVAATVVTQGLAYRYITISVGVAMAGEQDRDIEDVIERADRALYAAKSAGRNRVMLSQPGQQPSKAAA
jgi:diguanylate cyclase (GGDEF)-like protein